MKIDPLTGSFIGKGEDSAFTILDEFFSGAESERQMKLSNFLSEPELAQLSQHQIKETVDIYFWYMGHNFVFRVQDKSHKGRIRAQWDRLQKKLLEDSGASVYDLDWKECKELFKERVNYKSIIEVYNVIKNIPRLVPPQELIVKYHPEYFTFMSQERLGLVKDVIRLYIDQGLPITTTLFNRGTKTLKEIMESK